MAEEKQKEKVEILNLEAAALARAKEDAIRASIDRKAMDYGQKMQLFLSYEADARAARTAANELRDELEITDEELALLF